MGLQGYITPTNLLSLVPLLLLVAQSDIFIVMKSIILLMHQDPKILKNARLDLRDVSTASRLIIGLENVNHLNFQIKHSCH